MNKGITSKQVEEALGFDSLSTTVVVSEFHRKGVPVSRPVHRYEVVIDGDMDISMAELQALVALFGTVHVCGKVVRNDHCDASEGSAFYFEVSE